MSTAAEKEIATAAASQKEKMKALQVTLDKMEKTYGKGAIMRLGSGAVEQVEVIPTGSHQSGCRAPAHTMHRMMNTCVLALHVSLGLFSFVQTWMMMKN